MKGMKNNKLKALAVAMVLTMSAGMIPTTAGIEVPALTTTVEAAAKKITLKVDEIAPYYRHPVLNKTIHQLLNELLAKDNQ